MQLIQFFLLGEKYVAEKEKKEKESQIQWTLRLAATPKGSARTPLGPKHI